MRRNQFTCSRSFVQQEAEQWVQGCLQWRDYGRKVTGVLLARLLIMAASLGCSLSGVAHRSRCGVSGESLRKAVQSNLPEVDELTWRFVESFHRVLPRRVLRRPQTMAIDLHLRPYYGDRRRTHGIRGGQRKAGTKWFWTYASCVLVEHGQRWNVGLVPVLRGHPMEDVLAQLLEQIARSGLQIRCLLLDRGFYSAKVIELLQARRLKFIMPMIRRGKERSRQEEQDTGTQPFFRRDHQGFYRHQWTSRGKKKAGPTVMVRVACVPRDDQRPLVYVFEGPGWSLKWIHDTYRKRFGIETSYRQLGEGLAQTTSRDRRYRLLLVGLALLLRNVWVWCQNLAAADHLPSFNLILDWLRLLLDKCLTCIDGFETKTQPRSALTIAR